MQYMRYTNHEDKKYTRIDISIKAFSYDLFMKNA